FLAGQLWHQHSEKQGHWPNNDGGQHFIEKCAFCDFVCHQQPGHYDALPPGVAVYRKFSLRAFYFQIPPTLVSTLPSFAGRGPPLS
ncbi:MAG TPA: hypothetical protein VK518_08745, partial [Puia sp.]|nr:hypothetical protein [Puia sp.]